MQEKSEVGMANRIQIWRVGWVGGLAIATSLIGIDAGLTQIIPDDTLGNERSRVVRVGRQNDRDIITGGARRGETLFHSFERFTVENGLETYFRHSDGVEAIFSRVTGNRRSNIRGTLGVLGDADLFLLNPNGVLFGRNSSLDLNGSLTVTSVDAVQFDTSERFSALAPEDPPSLLTVYSDVQLVDEDSRGDIIVRSGSLSSPSRSAGLGVGRRESILLAGEDVRIERGQLNSLGGRIEIEALDKAKLIGRSIVDVRARFGDEGDIDISASRRVISDETVRLTGEIPGPDRNASNQRRQDAEGIVNGVQSQEEERTELYILISNRNTLIDTDSLLASSCVVRDNNRDMFLITGAGGLPNHPSESISSQYSTGAIRAISVDNLPVDAEWNPGDPIEEPQGLYQLSDGRIVLSQECTFE